MAESIEAVYMVEASPALRDAQKQLLCGDAPMIETETGFKSTSKYAGIPIMWTENMRFVPSGRFYAERQKKKRSSTKLSQGRTKLHSL